MARELQCASNEEITFDTQLRYQDEFNYLAREQQDLRDMNQKFRTCVDVDALDLAFPSLAFEASLANVSSVRQAVFHPSCTDSFNALDADFFRCENVKVCKVECIGPNSARIKASSFDAGCTIEWYGHSAILGGVMAVLVFILMNISRWLFLRGLVNVLWRFLATNKFSYLGSAYFNGQLEYPRAVAEKGKSMKEMIRKSLREEIGKFERRGWAILVAGVLMNVPWIVLLIIVSNDLNFKKSQADLVTNGD